jgi:Tfp pilus assembly major pilin PilA
VSETVTLIIVAAMGTVLAPSILNYLNNRAQAKARQADWARQDKVAARVEQVAIAAAEVAQAAAHEAAAVALGTTGQLATIHTLVNSNLTEAMRNELTATSAMVEALREVVDLRTAQGDDPGRGLLADITSAQRRVSALERDLAHKQRQTELAGGS